MGTYPFDVTARPAAPMSSRERVGTAWYQLTSSAALRA